MMVAKQILKRPDVRRERRIGAGWQGLTLLPVADLSSCILVYPLEKRNPFFQMCFFSCARLYCRLVKSLSHLCLLFSTEVATTTSILLDLKPYLLAQWSYTMSRGSSLGKFLRYRCAWKHAQTKSGGLFDMRSSNHNASFTTGPSIKNPISFNIQSTNLSHKLTCPFFGDHP